MQGIAGFIAATFAGLFVGTFGFGWLPDRLGRKAVFAWSLLCLGSAIMAFQTSSEGLVFRRLVTGISVGVEIVTIDVYVTELVPQSMRGRAMAFNQMIKFLAAPCAALLRYFWCRQLLRHRWMALSRADRLRWRDRRLVRASQGQRVRAGWR